ncbi:MAG: hypothetical protein HYX24_01175 [Candidatus Aenigmarchaeota archaeon]|nr:hypothetical protein [Candidatus Aenigmarchaeota archaeon]
MAKGISNTMWLVVASLVILIVALVILTIFSKSIGNIPVQFVQNCRLSATASCSSLGVLPIDWQIPKAVSGSQTLISCYNAVAPPPARPDCSAYGFPVPPTQNP